MTIERGGTLKATLLVSGCCIGAGMIGLPVISALAGFIPSSLAMILAYFFATGTGLLLLEATLWFDREVHLISMAGFALGRFGRGITWAFFLFLFYCIFVAYIDGGGQLFSGLFSSLFGGNIPRQVGVVACVGLVFLIVYAGTKQVSLVSRIFLVGLASSYLGLVSIGLPNVEREPLLHMDWRASLATIPILLICFGYQNLIPTLVYFANRNVRVLRRAIFLGNLIPFAVYLLWNFVILGLLPSKDSEALQKMIGKADLVTSLLERAGESRSILFFAQTFSFFGILTPFMTNTLAFVDFLKDGFNIPSSAKRPLWIYGLVLVPPTLLSLSYPHLFLKALGFAGGFADIVLFGILPVLIVSVGRYVRKVDGPYRAPGGKLLLGAVLLFSVFVLFLRR